MYAKVGIGLIIIGLGAVWLGPLRSNAAADGEVSLMATLAEWSYPDSKFGGANMSDGGNPRLQSIKCQAVLTTGDPVEKVIAFYSKKFEILPSVGPQDEKVEEKADEARSISTQDDSQGRPLELRVIVVNKADTSTTLVISRAKGEKETHIAWSHYLRLNGNR
jgi:hypothetical protein